MFATVTNWDQSDQNEVRFSDSALLAFLLDMLDVRNDEANFLGPFKVLLLERHTLMKCQFEGLICSRWHPRARSFFF